MKGNKILVIKKRSR